MQIACPQCAMQYVLDERLLPPGGAPVQCTRCSHVFTAVPGGTQRPTTQVFGAVTPAEGGPATGRASTQVFGSGSKPGAPARASTQVFAGGAPQPAERPPTPEARSTQVFGAPPPRASTQVFGSRPAEAPWAAGPSAGGEPPAAEGAAQPPRASTQVFGAGAPVRASTQVFGSAAAPPAGGAPRASTQVFGPGSEETSHAAPEVAPAPRASTQVFGAQAPAASGSPELPRSSTQMFGVQGPAASGSPELPRASTQVFGAQPPGALGSAEPTRSSTQVFGTPELSRGSSEPGPARPQRVDLPPELLSERGARPAPGPQRPSPPQPLRLRAGLWMVLLAVLVAVLAFLAWRTVHRRSAAFPVEAVSARESAATLLRRDDARSRQEAIASLEQVVKAHPDYVEARAEQVVALALELDDARFERSQQQRLLRDAQRERNALESAPSSEGSEQRVAQLGHKEAGYREAAAGLTERVEEAARKAESARRELGQASAEGAAETERFARARAHALLVAINGGPSAPALIEELRASGDAQGWDTIAQATYALNAPRSTPELRAAAAAALEALRQRDAAFLRAYVLGARLALASGDAASAASLADMALALNPAHDGARELRAMAREDSPEASPAD